MKISEQGMVALKACQQHWDRIALPDLSEWVGASSCALCQEFDYQAMCKSSTGELCPVRRATGLPSCRGTPYADAVIEKRDRLTTTTHRRAMRAFLYALPGMDELGVSGGMATGIIDDQLEDHRAITVTTMEQEQSNDPQD